ncbi:MAG: sunset domain-containing protein [Microthrixaceae bacterium]
MIRRSFRIGLTLGLLGGLAFALVKILGTRSAPAREPLAAPWPSPTPAPAPVPARAPTVATPTAAPTVATPTAPPTVAKPVERLRTPDTPAAPEKPAAPARAAVKKKPLRAAWVEPKGDVCPTTHPVKAKLASKIFHLPGMTNYARTKPDRCYKDGPTAERDGLRPAKR